MRPPEVLLQGAGLWGGRGKQALRRPAPLPGWVCVRSPASSALGSGKGHSPEKRRETSSSGSPAWFRPAFPGPRPPSLFP